MYKILGISDEVTTCECCGRSGLKRTVVLGTDSGEVHFGTDCASKALGMKGDLVSATAKAADYARKWLAVGRSAEAVASAIRVRWCNAWVENGTVVLG